MTKALAVDVLAEFLPFEKIESLSILRGDLRVGLDNDGGEVENRIVNTGQFQNLLR